MKSIIIGAVVLSVVTFCIVWEMRRKRAFEKRFPPISDEEFMARCPPGTDPKVALKVRRIFSEQLGIDYERIYPSSNIVNDLMAD